MIENGFSLAERSAQVSVSPIASDSKIHQVLNAATVVQLLYPGLGDFSQEKQTQQTWESPRITASGSTGLQSSSLVVLSLRAMHCFKVCS